MAGLYNGIMQLNFQREYLSWSRHETYPEIRICTLNLASNSQITKCCTEISRVHQRYNDTFGLRKQTGTQRDKLLEGVYSHKALYFSISWRLSCEWSIPYPHTSKAGRASVKDRRRRRLATDSIVEFRLEYTLRFNQRKENM